ncbi:Beta-lactamase [Caulifigura coniformis]|uniref:Beta-lactamase n=1 Tax=Caulifigura coniformis TaxID=2527983 RepID=A0A517SC53_9PLAN|nr:serine hydrolase domain-containing protein [Caulifigura coniformis]QDT53684.1 Beta-lactamase [Caulifigura coniformis]
MQALRCVLLALLVVSSAPQATRADDSTTLSTRVSQLTADYRAKRPFAALSVGLLQNGQSHTFSYGQTGEADSQRPTDGRTLFEIGSISKVFTSLALAVMVERGDVNLNDPLSRILPDATLSEDAGNITLHELSTHTSGLPRLPVAMIFDALWNRDNPYVAFDERRLEHFLSSWKAPDQRAFMYSNLGAGLLGHALQHKAGLGSYDSLLKSTIATPLGLVDTTVHLSADQKSRYASGYSLKGLPVSSWDFNALAGAGAIRSSTDDLLVFLKHQLNPEQSPLGKPITRSHKTRKQTKSGVIGLGWLIVEKDGRTLFFHNGATGGYTAFIGFEPGRKQALVLLSNTADAFARDNSLDKLGFKLLGDLGTTPEPPEAEKTKDR